MNLSDLLIRSAFEHEWRAADLEAVARSTRTSHACQASNHIRSLELRDLARQLRQVAQGIDEGVK